MKQSRVPINITLSKEALRKVAELQREDGSNRSSTIERLIRKAHKEMIRDNERRGQVRG